MRTKLLCCRTLEPEVRLAMERCGCTPELKVLQENNHDVPHKLRRNIQEELDAMTDADRVLMAFATCGGSMVGLRTGDFELVIPRLDDCLSLLMGSMEQRKAVLEGGFGMFVTESWIDHDKNIAFEIERIQKRYPPERAEKVIQIMYGNFDSLNVIDTGAYDVHKILPRTQKLAQQLNLKHRIVQGTTAYLEELLCGPYDPERFILIPPRSVVTDEDTLLCSLTPV